MTAVISTTALCRLLPLSFPSSTLLDSIHLPFFPFFFYMSPHFKVELI